MREELSAQRAAQAELERGDAAAALRRIDQALALSTTSISLAFKAQCQLQLGDFAAAASCAEDAFALDPNDPIVLTKLGNVFTAVQNFARARACFERAAARAPEIGANHYNLGTALRFAGEFEAAEAAFNEAIRLSPMDHEGIYARSGLRKQTQQRNNIAHLLECADRQWPDWRALVHICYALAKEYEDLGDWDQSFAWLKKGADLRKSNTRYDVATDVMKLKTLQRVFRSQAFEHSSGVADDRPIFVLGLPRSGSTLVERILSAHSEVVSAGELPTFGQKVVELAQPLMKAGKPSFEAFAEASLRIDPERLGAEYLQAARFATGGARRFVDKLPFNFLYIGLIRRALPNAKIIHIHRHPMDNCYGMYKVIFRNAYPFSYDLEDLGAYYVAYRALMEHWRSVLPNAIFDIRYEELVRDQEALSRDLIGHCGLEWEGACLTFHLNAAASTTASAVQVRRPINADAIDKWKRFETQLAPLAERLRASGLLSTT